MESALKALNEVKKFISAPEHILGSPLQKHGEVAEHMQVGFSNARAAVQGFRQMYTFDGVGRLAMEDYLRDGRMIQSKFCNGIQGTFSAIRHHLSDYPMFIADGGTYDIPRDQKSAVQIQILCCPARKSVVTTVSLCGGICGELC